jgi:O-antigen/teichoic acid export membrane protein
MKHRLPTLVSGMGGRLRLLLGSQLRRNVLTGVGTALVGAALGFLSYPLYLSYLGYQQYGLWVALSTVLTFAQLGNFGINPAITKFVAEAHGAGDSRQIRSCLSTAWVAVSVSGVVVLIGVLIFIRSIPALFRVSGKDAETMVSLLPGVGLFSLYVFLVEPLCAALVGLGRMDLENFFRILTQALSLVFSAILLHSGRGIESLLIANSSSYVLLHILTWLAVRRIAGTKLLDPRTCAVGRLSQMLRFGGWVFGASLMNMALSPVIRVVLARSVGVASLPVFEIAFNTAMRVRGLLESGLRALMPEISRLSRPATQETLLRAGALSRTGTRLICRLGIPLYLVIGVFATPLLRMWLRSQFQPEVPASLRIMLIGSFLSLLCVPGYYILLGLGEAGTCFNSALLQAGATLAFIAIVFRATGVVSVTGVSVAVMLGMGCCSAYVIWRVSRFLNGASEGNRTAVKAALGS